MIIPSTVDECIREGERRFTEHDIYLGHGTDNCWDEALQLVCHVLNIRLDAPRDVLQNAVSPEQWQAIEHLFARRVNERIPVPYLIGRAWFLGMPFVVTPDVLIPRSPIAELIDRSFAPWMRDLPRQILDLCCGGGCIGVASALAWPDATVLLTDISPAALHIAQRNIDAYEVEERVTVLQSDLFDQIPEQRFDLILSNPPYVDAQDMAELPPEYWHEPRMALEAGQDGLRFVHRILRDAGRFLSDDGLLIVEVGNSWPALEAAYPQVPFTWVEFERGGDGVFLLTAQEWRAHQQYFTV